MKEHSFSIFAKDLVFVEGPRWRDGHLWVSDMWDFKVLRFGADGSRETMCDIPGRPSGLGFLPDGTPLVVSMADRKIFRIGGNGAELYADVSGFATGDLNDLLVDDQGLVYSGNFGFDLFGGAEAKLANVVLVSEPGQVKVVADEMNFPNGMVFLDGGHTLVVAETFGNLLTAFDRAPDGSLSNRRVYAQLGERTPDGICVDKEGGIWVSSFMTDEFIRIGSDGAVTDRIGCEGRRAVACALGGQDGRTLFCSTFAGDLDEAAHGKRAGAIETITVDVPGW